MNKVCSIIRIDEDLSREIAGKVRRDNLVYGGNVRAALIVGKKWAVGQTISVGFMSGTNEEKEMIKKEVGEWLNYANLFIDWKDNVNECVIRVKVGGVGSYSSIGTDALGISKGKETIQYGWLDPGVIKHEFGHALGLIHSHESNNFPYHFREDQVIKDLSGPPNNWDEETIRWNVLTRVREADMETPWTPDQVMNYYMKKSWLVEGIAVEPGNSISESEKQLVAFMYPKGVNEKVIGIGEMKSGIMPDHYSLNVSQGGLYNVNVSPRNAVILINGRQSASLISLSPGRQSLDIRGSGNYNLVIRKW